MKLYSSLFFIICSSAWAQEKTCTISVTQYAGGIKPWIVSYAKKVLRQKGYEVVDVANSENASYHFWLNPIVSCNSIGHRDLLRDIIFHNSENFNVAIFSGSEQKKVYDDEIAVEGFLPKVVVSSRVKLLKMIQDLPTCEGGKLFIPQDDCSISIDGFDANERHIARMLKSKGYEVAKAINNPRYSIESANYMGSRGETTKVVNLFDRKSMSDRVFFVQRDTHPIHFRSVEKEFVRNLPRCMKKESK